MAHNTEQQQYEELIGWIKKNRLYLITLIVLSLGTVIGWNYWQSYQLNKNQSNSYEYTKAILDFNTNNDVKKLDQFIHSNDKNIYTTLALLQKAKTEVNQKNYTAAIESLKIAHDSSKDGLLQNMINYRLAQVLYQNNDYANALQTLDKINQKELQAIKFELIGDISFEQKDIEKTKMNYIKAQNLLEKNTNEFNSLELKIKSLGI